MSVHVAIAIVGFRNPADVQACLAALGRASYPDFEVVICENGGAAAFEVLRGVVPSTLAGGQVVRVFAAPGNIGFAGGVNACLTSSSDADAWWVLNPDTQPEPQALGALVARLEAGDCDAVGGVLFGDDGRVQSFGGRWRSWLARAKSIGFGQPLAVAVDGSAVERMQTYLIGASMLVSRRFVDTVGPMREDYFLYCEEVEWCLRALDLGMRLGFAPDARVLHARGTTTGAHGSMRQWGRVAVQIGERNAILLTRDHYPAQLPIAAVAALGMHVIKCVRQRAWRQLGYGLAGWWEGIRGRRGRPAWIPL